jgi:hypothetical protein
VCAVTTTDSVSVLLNDGTGALGSLATYAVDDWATGLAAGDLDGDAGPRSAGYLPL